LLPISGGRNARRNHPQEKPPVPVTWGFSFFICGNIPSDGLTDRQIGKSFFLKDTLDEAISRSVKNKKKPA